VISGPHFYVGTPFNKTPRSSCTANGHYDDIDLTAIPDDYLRVFHQAIPEWPKPRRPEPGRGGFWPVSDAEVPAYEALLGEPLRRHGIDPDRPGARTARQFGYFIAWEGDVEGAVSWLLANDNRREAPDFTARFAEVRLRQGLPDADTMR
jgi:hypothetical protein